MKKQMKKQMLSLVVSAAMTASMMPKPALAADNTTFPDMPNDWSTQALQNAINNGLLNGIDGKIAAGENLTRAQMAAIVTRAFGTNGKADISSFGDVNTGDWFYDAMASSVLMGAIQGDGVNLNPNTDITRQEAFTVLARLFTLSGGDQSVLNSYTDGDQVADWAKDSMASMVAAGYVKGFDNKLNPQDSITRAEFAQVMDNLVKTYFADSQLNVNADGNAVLNKAGTLEGATISGDLIIGDGAAEGDVVLKDVTVSGRLLVRGGGTSTVTLEGNTTVSSIVVNKPTGAVRVENTTDKAVNVNAVSNNVVLTGEYDQVNANASQGTITLNDADVATMNVAGTSAKVVVENGSTVTTISVTGADATVKAEEGAKIEKITTSAANTTVSGEGSVTNFEAAQGSSGASITTDGTKVTNNGTGDVTTGNDKVIASGSTGTSQSDSTTPGGGGSTGGGGGSTGGGSTGGEDEGTPILPVSGIVGVKPVDQSADDKIPEEQMPNVTASATQNIVSKVVTIKLSTDKEVPLHQNANHTEGYWVGVAVEVPDDVNEINYYFGTTANATANEKTSPTVDPTIGDKKYFVAFINAGSTTPKTHLTLQWGENEAVQYVIDLSGVKVGIQELEVSAASQHGEDFTTIGESFVLDENNEIPAEAAERNNFTQEQIAALGCVHTDKQSTETCTCLYKSLTLYVKVNGKLPTFNKVTQKYMTADGKLATMEYKTNIKNWAYADGKLAGEAGRYGVKDGNDYLKLALYAFYRPSADSTWGLISSDAAKQVLEFYNGDNKVATAEFASPLAGYTVTDAAEGAKVALAKAEAKLTSGVAVKGTADAGKVQNAVKEQIGEIAGYTVEATEASGDGSSWTVKVTVTGTGDDKASKVITLAVTEDIEETVATVDALKTALTNEDVLTVTVASDLGKLSEDLEVPAGKTLVIGEGGKLDAYDVALSGAGSVVVKGGTLKINANYNGGTGTDSKLPTIATIQVNHGGTLASMTTNEKEEQSNTLTNFVGPDKTARIQTMEDASVTFKLGSLGEGSKPTMTIAGNVIIPEGKTWYSMFDTGVDPNGPAAAAGDAIGIDMTLEKGKMTVNGTLVLSSASRTGSSLTVGSDASVEVNGTVKVNAYASVTANGRITGGGSAKLIVSEAAGTAKITGAGISGVADHSEGTYTWSTESSTWTTGA